MPRELHIETFAWRGQVRYKCPECAFDTYTLNGQEGMLYHIAKSHSAKPVVPTEPTPKLFDGSGNELKPEPEVASSSFQTDVTRVLKKRGLDDASVHLHPEGDLTKEQVENAVRSDSPSALRGADAGQELPVPDEE